MRRPPRPAPLEMATWEEPLDRYVREQRRWAIITAIIIALPTLVAIGIMLLAQRGVL